MAQTFEDRIEYYGERVTKKLDVALPAASERPERLHEAMRYAVFAGGKRIRPLLVYAAGEVLSVDEALLDAPAVSIELIHTFSLVHDDLPAMDDDDLRRGKPTVHRRYDEATAILAADALQPLAFAAIAGSPHTTPAQARELVRLVADACGSRGMTGGQSIDLSSEGKRLDAETLELMYRLKTGALIRAAVLCAACVSDDAGDRQRRALEDYADCTGLAFQIRDDLLDVEGETVVIGKPAGSDLRSDKATWPAMFGIDAARERCDELLGRGLDALDPLGERAEPLRWLARYIVERST